MKLRLWSRIADHFPQNREATRIQKAVIKAPRGEREAAAETAVHDGAKLKALNRAQGRVGDEAEHLFSGVPRQRLHTLGWGTLTAVDLFGVAKDFSHNDGTQGGFLTGVGAVLVAFAIASHRKTGHMVEDGKELRRARHVLQNPQNP